MMLALVTLEWYLLLATGRGVSKLGLAPITFQGDAFLVPLAQVPANQGPLVIVTIWDLLDLTGFSPLFNHHMMIVNKHQLSLK